jgi:DNA-binding transcriptional regulator YiaG
MPGGGMGMAEPWPLRWRRHDAAPGILPRSLEYNAFLFAAVGEEAVGLPLTVLTALARLGIDPWQEAARLSDLPRETAAQVFALTIAELPEGDWKAADAAKIAARLVDSLPLRSAPPIPSTAVQRARGSIAMKNSRFPAWLGWSALFVAALVLTLVPATRSES